MVNHSAAAGLDATFHALSDPTRRAMVARLADRPETPVAELARPFRMSKPAISKHLRVLEGAGLLARRRDGRVHHLRLVPAPLETANEWLDRYRRFWDERLEALARYLEQPNEEEPWPPPKRPLRRRSASRARTRRPAKKSSGPGRTRRR